jgi:hypothetical protein
MLESPAPLPIISSGAIKSLRCLDGLVMTFGAKWLVSQGPGVAKLKQKPFMAVAIKNYLYPPDDQPVGASQRVYLT